MKRSNNRSMWLSARTNICKEWRMLCSSISLPQTLYCPISRSPSVSQQQLRLLSDLWHRSLTRIVDDGPLSGSATGSRDEEVLPSSHPFSFVLFLISSSACCETPRHRVPLYFYFSLITASTNRKVSLLSRKCLSRFWQALHFLCCLVAWVW